MFSGMTITLLLQIASAAFAGFAFAAMFVWSIWAANRLLRSGAKIWRLPPRIYPMFVTGPGALVLGYFFPDGAEAFNGQFKVSTLVQIIAGTSVGATFGLVASYAMWMAVQYNRSGRADGDWPIWIYAAFLVPTLTASGIIAFLPR